MNKKKLNILLLILVLSIWGKLIYNYTKKVATPIMSGQNNYQLKDIIKVEKKNFELSLLERDPFLNKMRSKVKTNIKSRTPYKKTKVIKNYHWPKITYLGYIKNQSSNQAKLAILKVEGSIKNCKESSFFNENIYIRKIYKDSIQLEVNNQYKTIKK